MKVIKYSFLLITGIIIAIFFYIMVNKTIETETIIELTKLNIYSQIFYVGITTILIFLTYKALKLTQQQKHHIVQPHIVLTEFGFWRSNTQGVDSDLLFKLENVGKGQAFNLEISIRMQNERKTYYKTNCARLSPIESDQVLILSQIRDEINNSRVNGGNGIKYSPYFSDEIEIDIPLEGNKEDFFELIISVKYKDLYGKKYISTMKVKMMDEEEELIDLVERFRVL